MSKDGEIFLKKVSERLYNKYDEDCHLDKDALENTIIHLFKRDYDKSHTPLLRDKLGEKSFMLIDELFYRIECGENPMDVVSLYEKGCKHSYRRKKMHTTSMTCPLDAGVEDTIEWFFNKLVEQEMTVMFKEIIDFFRKKY